MPSLLIISHTKHYKTENGIIVGWEPTVREINHLTKLFDTIIHAAPLYFGIPHTANISYSSNKISFIPLIPTGGKSIFKKIGIILFMPINLIRIIKIIKKVEWVHFRAPTNLGLFVLPLLLLYKNKKKWFKYAGSWKQKSIPFSYRLQRWWLRNNFNNSIVTINGNWEKQNNHLLSFYNPCLTENELIDANRIGTQKDFSDKLNLCFVGRLEKAKGFPALLDAFCNLSDKSWINKLHCVGEMTGNNYFKELLSDNNISIQYHGMLNRKELNKIYMGSHFIILPSLSEGFPKVLVEASSFGCIPIVPPIKSILSQFNEEKQNCIVLKNTTPLGIKETIDSLQFRMNEFSELSKNAMKGLNYFSYESYYKRILSEIIQN